MTKDICSIKTRINQLIATQSSQCDTLIHIISILNITQYATQVNRHSINNLIDAIHTATQDIDNLYNVTTSLASSISFNQMILHITSVFTNLHDSMHYVCTLFTHTKDYIDTAFQAYYHIMSFLLWTYGKCYSILLMPYLLLCTYQYRQWTPCTFTGICVHIF